MKVFQKIVTRYWEEDIYFSHEKWLVLYQSSIFFKIKERLTKERLIVVITLKVNLP